MKKIPSRAIALAIAFLFYSQSVISQIFTGSAANKLVAGSSRVIVDEERKSISFITIDESNFIGEETQEQWLRSALKLKDAEKYNHYKKESDKYGFSHYRYRQAFKNIPVEYGVFYIHTRNGRVVSANGERYENISVNTSPSKNIQECYEKAVSWFGISKVITDESVIRKPELFIFPLKTEYKLAYRFDLFAEAGNKRAYIYVDAHTGSILKEANRIMDGDAIGTAVTMHNGTVTITTDSLSPTSFRLRESGRGNGIITWDLNNTTNYAGAVDFTDSDNLWNTTTNQDHAAYDAHFGAEKTYDFYFDNFGRNSYNDSGAVINSYVHYSTGYVNAFWNGSVMTYGDGNGTQYLPLTSMEVVGHEITHAVTEHTAGLIYAGESGALNESFSDIFGNTIRFLYSPSVATWFVGDQIVIPGSGATPFRNMADPNQFDCADTYGGLFWNNGDIVHYDSGVQNFWYYLLTTGGSGVNDIGNAYLVNGIGMADAMAIAYRNLSVYLTPSSNFMASRNGAIQAAIDLFGSCSNQVVQTTNAWYAVGVGGLFSNAVIAGFNAPNTFHCVVPATVNFSNTSLNATSYQWDFGDGNTSTLANPSHTYSSAGNYTVQLIASGSGTCSSVDTLIISNYISVTNGGGPVSAACTPNTISYCCGVGITNFQFKTINKSSTNASEGYKDFTCSNATTITAGDAVAISVTTGLTTNENVKAFIDYDNDGSFNNTNEAVFVSNNKLQNHTGVVNTPVTATLNTPLRMRVIDDNAASPITNSCTNPNDGQAEDYTVTFVANTLPPVADFTSNITTVNVGSSVNFYDLSINAPLTWEWQFSGGTPTTSVVQNPVVTYSTVGVYPVQLKITNSFGADSIVKTNYISVVNFVNMCSGVTSTTALNGIFYDSGGPTGNYMDNENCTFLIQPPCADTITLSFTSFQTESGFDYLRVYNGTSAAAPILLNYAGSNIPAPVIATSGAMFIQFISDGSVIYNGWVANWSTTAYSSGVPVADFAMNDTTPPLNVDVQFTDITSNSPNAWLWDFGDGNTSTQQNPKHAYATPGAYTIQLISYTCSFSDTISKSLIVQQAPAYWSSPDSINVSINCGDSITVPIMIVNSGAGELYVQPTVSGQNQTLEVLALQYGTDLVTEYPNTINAINQYFTDYNLSTINSTSPSALQAALAGKDVFLMTEPENGSPSVYSGFAPVLQSFVSQGGTAILCGSHSAQSACIFNTSLFSGSYLNDGNGQPLTINNPAHPILSGVSPPLTGTNGTYIYNITNPDIVSLVNYTTGNAVAYRPIGSGRAVYLAFDYYASSPNVNRIVSNAVKWAQNFVAPPWITVNPDSVLIVPGDTGYIYVTLNSLGLDAGTYSYFLVLNTNDPLNPVDTIPVTMTIGGPAVIAMSDTCIHFGSILQNTSSTDSVLVVNYGCDTLDVSNIISSAAEFVLQSSSVFSIGPGDSAYIVVSFNPTVAGAFSGQLMILNNDQDTTICLDGSATLAPAMIISPDSVIATLSSCNDSITIPVQFINSGGGTLQVSIAGDGTSQLQVLALTYGTDLSTEYPNTIAAINQYFTNYVLTTINTTNASTLQAALAGKDVFLMTEPESGTPSVYAGFATVLQSFVNGGGTAVFCGAYSAQSACIFNTGLFSGTFASDANGLPLTVVNSSHPITAGLPGTFNGSNGTYVLNITNPDKNSLVKFNTSEVVSWRSIGSGKAIFIAFDYFTPNDVNANRIIGQTFEWLGNANIPWLNLSQDTLSASGGDTVTVYITLYGAGLSNGTYSAYLTVTSNDPLIPVDTIPVLFTISAPPCMSYSYSVTACNGMVAFTDSSSNSPTSWLWDFGDGSTSVLQNPVHQYTAPGSYTVKLISCNTHGCDSLTQTVVISNLILANFTFSGSMVVGQPVQFTDNSFGATSWLWDFDDGFLSTLQNPVHSFASPGTYIVSLTINGSGCVSTFIDTIVILPVGIHELIHNSGLIIYPNPVKSETVIQFSIDRVQAVSLIVFDAAGKRVRVLADDEMLKPGTHQFMLRQEKAGNYYLRIKGDSIFETVRFVKLN